MDSTDKTTASDTEGLYLFLTALDEASEKFGFAIGGDPTIFIMDPEDRHYSYQCDAESNLVRG